MGLIQLDPWVREFIESKKRFNWLNCGRQLGKSTGLVIRRIGRGVLRGRLQIIVSASQRQTDELAHKAQTILRAGGLLNVRRDTASATHIQTPQLRMVFLPPNPATIRGYTGDVAWDEAAMTRDDREVWGAIFPMVTRQEGELDIASTPKGLKNKFAELRDNPQFQHTTVTLDAAIGRGLKLNRQRLYDTLDDEELFRQEYLCEFIDEATAFLTYEQIRRCFHAGLAREDEGPSDSTEQGDVFMGVDLGRKRDLTVIWQAQQVDEVLRSFHIVVLRNRPFREQYEMLKALLSDRRVQRCCIDATYEPGLAEAAVEDFGSLVEPVSFSAPLKSRLAGELRDLVQQGHMHIPADERIANDWHSVRRDVTALGAVRYRADHTDDGHADRFWAAALCAHAAHEAGNGEIPVAFF